MTMHYAEVDGQPILASEREKAVQAVLDECDVSVVNTKLTPELLTYMDGEIWSQRPTHERVTKLCDLLAGHAPIREIAREHVLGELVIIRDEGAENTPNDISPLDSDDYRYSVLHWLQEHVAVDHFAEDVFAQLKDHLTDKARDEISGLWSDVSDDIGNPARATDDELVAAIDELERA